MYVRMSVYRSTALLGEEETTVTMVHAESTESSMFILKNILNLHIL